MKNKIIYICILFAAIGAVLGIICYNKLNKSNYAINLPVSEELSSIVIEQNNKNIEIEDSETMKDILYVLGDVKRTTTTESIQDSPINVDNEIKVDLNHKEGGISTVWVYEKDSKYYIEQPYNGIYRISPDEYNSIEKHLKTSSENGNTTSGYVPDGMDIADENDIGNSANTQKFNRSPENVDIKIDNETIKPVSVSIIITDNNEDHYGWGVEFRVQKKIDGEWKDLDYVIDDVSWVEIAYELNEDNQLNQNLDIDKYYGKLSSGTYRIVKPVYDNGYVDIYSNEFEIK